MSLRALTAILPLLSLPAATTNALAVQSTTAAEPEREARVARPPLADLLAAWRAQHGASWRLHVAQDTGFLEMLAGGRAAPRWTPRDDAGFARLAREVLVETVALHGLEDATLELQRALHLPLGIAGSTDKTTVRFRQVVRGVPVENGWANLLFDARGALLSIQSTGLPLVAGFATSPTLDGPRAVRRALEWFVAQHGIAPTFVGEPQLVVDQVELGGERAPRLAWKVDVQRVDGEGHALGRHVFVDARDGVAYRTTPSVHFLDVGGSVYSLATPGLAPDTATNPPTAQPLRFARVTSGAVTTFTDTNGDFTLPGVTAPAAVTVEYAAGLYSDALNAVGPEHALTQTLVNATGNVLTLNAPASPEVTAQANCARVVPLLRDFIHAVNPSDAHADFALRSNSNLPGQCNALYDGSSIHLYAGGLTCPNSAFSTVITHEAGHWMNDLYGTGNGTDGIGEGNADVWAMYVHDTPVIAQDMYGPGTFVRTGLNTRPFCGDTNPSCYADLHVDGEPWMGAAWKVRARLNTTHGDAVGDLIADTLFLAWMSAYNQADLKSIIETQWLTLDDLDGVLTNGTPHFTDIDSGFRDQAFPGVTLPSVSISGVTHLPDTAGQPAPYDVFATIEANVSPPVLAASLLYRVEGGAFVAVPMTPAGGNAWTAQIPPVAAPAHVEYYVAATDSAAQTSTFPATAPNEIVEFDVGTVHVLRSYSFDTSGDEGWTHATVGDTSSNVDDWQRGTPAGKTGAGWADPWTAFSPSTCWATDLGLGATNGAYGANVHAYLRMPATSCVGATNVRVRFRRWLSVQGSGADQARILVNGQQVYVNPTTDMDDAGWTQQEVFLGPIADGNPSVQVEWRIRSNNTANFGGWNIDDVRLVWLEAPLGPCTSPTTFCSTAPNSVGPGATMGWQGTPHIATNNFELIASGLPSGSPGRFVYGPSTMQQPFGNGFRCVGGTTYSLPVVMADFFGDAHQPLNYAGLPGPIAAGQQWHFQYWYRNPLAGGAGFNLSDGLSVTFCP